MPRPRKDPTVTQVQQKPGQLSTLSPLEHLLAIMNDPSADPARRDKAAVSAAPYCHARVADKGVKAQQAETAEKAGGVGSEWADDLHPDGWPRPQ